MKVVIEDSNAVIIDYGDKLGAKIGTKIEFSGVNKRS